MTDEQLREKVDALLEEAGGVTPPRRRMTYKRLHLFTLVMLRVWQAAHREGVSLEVNSVGTVSISWTATVSPTRHTSDARR
jgi:hypothetical protein